MFTQKQLEEVWIVLQSPEVSELLWKLLIEFNYAPEDGNPLVFILTHIASTYEGIKAKITFVNAISDRKSKIVELQSEIDSIERGEVPIDEL